MISTNQESMSARTLDDVDPPAWGAPPADATYLVRRAHQLRRVPLNALQPEDLRLLIAQQIALASTVPLALEILRSSPLAAGDYYPGDLLLATMRVPDSYWSTHADQRTLLADIALKVDLDDPELPRFHDDTEFERLLHDYRSR